jgi:hypothetical protein
VVARAEPGRAGDLVHRVDVLGRLQSLQRQHPVHLQRQGIAHHQGDHPVLQVVGRWLARDIGVVVLLPGHRAIGEPAGGRRHFGAALARQRRGQHGDDQDMTENERAG